MWGIFDAHVVPYAWERGYKAVHIPQATKRRKSDRKTKGFLNAERPRLFLLTPHDLQKQNRSFYVLSVFPGSDYVYHYARMVRQVMELMRPNSSETLLEVRRFPLLEDSIVSWTSLDQIPIARGDLVIMGHIREYLHWFLHCDKAASSESPEAFSSFVRKENEGDYFSPVERCHRTMDDLIKDQQDCMERSIAVGNDFSGVLQIAQPSLDWSNWAWEILPISEKVGSSDSRAVGLREDVSVKRIFFLGGRYSYWGNISMPIAKFLYSKTDFVIYGAKCGTLMSEKNIETIVIPHEYAIVEEPVSEHEATVNILRHRSRQFLFSYKSLQLKWKESGASVGGVHVSVPTLVGETYKMRELIGTAADKDSQIRVTAALISMKLQSIPYRDKKERLSAIKSMKSHSAAMSALTALAYQYLPHKEAAQLFSHLDSMLGKSEADPLGELSRFSHHRLELLSMDNETSWFALAAAQAHAQDYRPRYFQAIHRTTDYVRSSDKAAVITSDDLAAERTDRRNELLEKIGKMLYDMLVINRWHPDGTDRPQSLQDYAAAKRKAEEAIFGDIPQPHRARLRSLAAAGDAAAMEIISDAPVRPAIARIPSGGLYNSRPMSMAELLTNSTLVKPIENRPLRWGILGAAQIAKKFAAAVISSPGSRLVAVSSRSREKGRQFMESIIAKASPDNRPSMVLHDDYEDLLMDSVVDAVYIPLPNDMHSEWVNKALLLGKHVLVEKPAALTVDEVWSMSEMYLKSRRHLAEGMPFLFNPLFDQVRQDVAALGAVLSVSCGFLHPIAARGADCIALHASRGGGSLYALGCYVIAAMMRLCPSINECDPIIEKVNFYSPGVDLSMSVKFVAPGGTVLKLECSIDADTPKSQYLEIECEHGTVSVPNIFMSPDPSLPSQYSISRKGIENPVSREAPAYDYFLAEIEDFEAVVNLMNNSPLSDRDENKPIGAHPFGETVEEVSIMEKIARKAGIGIGAPAVTV